MRFAILLVAACGGAQPASPASGPTCAQAAANEALVRDRAEEVHATERSHTLTVEEKTEHCKVDFWSPESIRCFAETKEWEAMKLCYDTLSSEQTGEIVHAIKAKR